MMYHQKAPHRNWMPAPRHLGMFNNTVFPEPATLFDTYEGRGSAAREQDMSIEHTLTNDWDLKLLTREEVERHDQSPLSGSTNVSRLMCRINGIQYMPSALPSIAVVNWKVKS